MADDVRYTRESYFEDYIQGESFQKRRNNHKLKYPKSYYCYICDCKQNLNWHHVDYMVLEEEDFFRDGWWECDPRCPCSKCDIQSCQRNCHFRSHLQPTGARVPKVKPALLQRRQELREQYEKAYIGSSTLFTIIPRLAHLYYRKIYRLLW